MVGKLRFALLVIFTFMILVSFSQQGNIRISPEGDSVFIQPIPLAEIPNRIENSTSRIKKIEGRLSPSGDLAVFDSIYENHVEEFKNKKTELESREGYYSLMTIENDIREWTNVKDILGPLKEKINSRVTNLQDDLFGTGTMKANWDATIESATKSGVPASALTSAKDLLKKINTLNKKVGKSQNEALKKQNQMTGLLLKIDDIITQLETSRRELQSDYFRQDSPPIWRAGDTTTNIRNVRNQIISNKNESIRNLENFYNTYQQTIYLHLLLFIAIWLSLYFLRRNMVKNEDNFEDHELDNSKAILSHYGISAFILAIFASIWLYPTLPNTIGNLIQFIYIIIAFFLLPKYIDKRINKLLIGLLILFFFNQLQSLFFGKVFFARLMIFLEIFLSGYLLFILIDPKGFISKSLKKYKWGFLLKIIPIFFLFLGLSIIANIFGFVDLAVLLNNTVINALFNLNILLLAIAVLYRVVIILFRTPFIQRSNLIKNHTEEFEKRFFQIIQIFVVYLWLRSILRLLGLHEAIVDWLNEFILETYKVGTTTIKIEGIISFILTIIITIIIYRFVKALLKEELYPRIKLPRGVPGAISMITGYVIAGFGFFIALGAVVDLSTFGLMAGALGVGIGFGLQGIVANFIAGLVLAFERPIEVGDEIELPQSMGIVTSIGVRSTTIRTYDGSEVIIPNSDLITKDVINWTLTDRKKRRDIYIGVAYGTDPEIVLELIKKVAAEHPNVLKIPAPWALFDGFGDSSLNFRIRIWTTMDTGLSTKSEVTVAVYDALSDAGIEIPFPQRDLHIKSLGAEVQKELNKKETSKTAGTTRTRGTTKATPGKKNEKETED